MRAPAIVVALASANAFACAVCGVGQGTQDNEWAYLAMTAVLSLLPLAMMGGVVAWLFRRAKAADAAAHPAPVDVTLSSPSR